MNFSASAFQLSKELLATAMPRRWIHVRAVAGKAERISTVLPLEDRQALVAAAWLHDVGYAPPVVSSGLHALDGARWLRRRGFEERVAALVAYHSCALFEAEERGLAEELRAEFSDEESPLRDALWYADMTTGPEGQDMTVQERLAEVRVRYGPDHLVSRFWTKAQPALTAAVQRTEERLAAPRS